jgi:hypothetical protein
MTLLVAACGGATSEPTAAPSANTVDTAGTAAPTSTVPTASGVGTPAPATTNVAPTIASSDVALVEPAEDTRSSGAALHLVAHGEPGAQFRFEYRRFDDVPWSPVPDARLTAKDGAPTPQPIATGADGTTPTIVWNARETGESDVEISDNSLEVADDVPFVVRVVDVASGTASDAHLVTLDRTMPGVALEISPDAPEVLTGTRVTIRWRASEEVAGYAVYDNGDEPAVLTPDDAVTAPPTRHSGSITATAPGRKFFIVRALDTSGNWGLPSEAVIDFVDALVTSPPESQIYRGDEVLKLTQTLAGTGVGHVCWQYRRAGSADWMNLPTSSLTYENRRIRSWPVAVPRGTAESFVWHDWTAAREIRNNPGGVTLRTLIGRGDNACDGRTATEVDARDFFYEPRP